MTLKRYLILMSLATLICWLAWLIVIFKIDPYGAGFLAFLFFYLSFFLALTGTFATLGLIVRIWLIKHELVIRQAGTAFRQAILFSVLIIGVLILLSLKLLTWWIITLFIAVLAVLEFFFLSYSHK